MTTVSPIVHPSPPFRDFEVSAILREVAEAGTGKSMFRRPLKPQPFIDWSENFCVPDRDGGFENWGQNIDGTPCTRNFIKRRAPFAIGDLLWCRETHCFSATGGYDAKDGYDAETGANSVWFRATDKGECDGPWRPSTQMPRWASRLTLEVLDVKIERLQEISDNDALAEGVCETEFYDRAEDKVSAGAPWSPERLAFANMWNRLGRGLGWAANQFVAAVTFRPHLINVDEFLRQREGT